VRNQPGTRDVDEAEVERLADLARSVGHSDDDEAAP
jgi:hypothetical protein